MFMAGMTFVTPILNILRMSKNKIHLALGLLAMLLAMSIILNNQYSYAETVEVEIRDAHEDPDKRYVLHPEEITVDVGTTVVWTNMHDGNAAIISGKPKEIGTGDFFSSDWIKPREKFSYTFNNEGQFPYFTSSFPPVTGKVIVKGESEGSTILLSPNVALPSEKIIIQGTGFDPHIFSFPSELTIELNGKTLQTIREVVIDESGFFIAGIWLPFDASKGRHQITVRDSAGNRASAELTICDFANPEWETVHTVGKFLNFELHWLKVPPKPDQTFKMQYRVINGTVEEFYVANIPERKILGQIVAQVNSNNDGILEILFPRNFPYTNEGYARDVNGDNASFIVNGQFVEYNFGLSDCFFLFSVPFTGSSEIELLWSHILINTPHDGDNIPYSCIPQTLVDVPVRNDGTIATLYQLRVGVAAEDVLCREGLGLVIRSDGKPYCVTPSTAERLAELWK